MSWESVYGFLPKITILYYCLIVKEKYRLIVKEKHHCFEFCISFVSSCLIASEHRKLNLWIKCLRNRARFWVRVGPDTRLQPRVDPARGPQAQGPGQPGAATKCLVQHGHKTRALFLLYHCLYHLENTWKINVTGPKN